jgi:hypothetical protein
MDIDIPPRFEETPGPASSRRSPRALVIRAISEFLLIVAGVLTALAADGWRDERAEIRLEQEYLVRLTQDLQVDTLIWRSSADDTRQKLEALSRLRAWLQRPDTTESGLRGLASDIAKGARLAYVGTFYAQESTYDELINTGRFHLIRDPQLRRDLAQYYRRIGLHKERLGARVTTFAPLSYELIPRESEFLPSPDLSYDELRQIGSAARAQLGRPAVAEANRAGELLEVLKELDRAAKTLLLSLGNTS